MSTAIFDSPKMTMVQRSQYNAERIASELGLDNLKVVNFAVLEAALQEIEHNKEFAQLVKRAFEQFAPAKKSSKRQSSKPNSKGNVYTTPLVPIGIVEDYRLDLSRPPDPFFLVKVYGMHQLYQALDEHNLASLKRSVAEQMALHPNTKPKTKTKKEDIIAYLIDLVKQSEGEH
jgi:hypothetical protein